jgi:carboxymethylenebutenolidase
MLASAIREGGIGMDQRIIDLFDRFTHGGMRRREFLERLSLLAGSAAAASALLPLLENNYAKAEIVPENDQRIAASTKAFGEKLSGYLVAPAGGGKHPAVIVIHENRGLNPHIKDVARRFAVEGFLAFAPDYLFAMGGTPEDADKARDMIGKLTPEDTLATSRAALAALNGDTQGTGKTGVVGFCWGGGQVNALAVADPALAAGVAYYGRQPQSGIENIKAPLLLHYAGLDERINAGIAGFEKALKANGKAYELYMYEGANHAFNNDTNAARYNKEAANLAWGRTIAFLKKHLA